MMFHIPALFKAPFPVLEWLVRLLSGLSAANLQGNKKRSTAFPLAAFLTSFLTGTNRSFDQMSASRSVLMPVWRRSLG
jgi:hypothetical protein